MSGRDRDIARSNAREQKVYGRLRVALAERRSGTAVLCLLHDTLRWTSYGMHWALRNRTSFAGHDRATQWDQLQRLHFSSYAMWNSLTTPFLFAQPGGGIDDCFEACSLMGRLLSQEWEGVYWVATRNVRTRRQERVGDKPSNGPPKACRLASLYPKLAPYLHDRLSAMDHHLHRRTLEFLF
jgi:hypothetical protein